LETSQKTSLVTTFKPESLRQPKNCFLFTRKFMLRFNNKISNDWTCPGIDGRNPISRGKERGDPNSKRKDNCAPLLFLALIAPKQVSTKLRMGY
jgi:hypothetical protein